MGWVLVRPTRGQLWDQLSRGDSAARRPRPGQRPRVAARSLRRFVIVGVEGDVVTTADVDEWTWTWRVDLQPWSAGEGDEAVAVEGPFTTTTVDALRSKEHVQIADPQHVHCQLPVIVPMQGVLFDFSGVAGGRPMPATWSRLASHKGSGAMGTSSTIS
jgi:hypothetical protein